MYNYKNIIEKKKELRKQIKEKVQKLSKEYCKDADSKVAQKLFQQTQYKNAKIIFIYVGKENEINTTDIIKTMLKHNKIVVIPKCVSKTEMKVYRINKLEDLTEGMFKILEPKVSCKEVLKEDIDLTILPCCTVDKYKNRLGFGRGYYDRFLENLKVCKIVLIREQIMIKKVPTDKNDIPVDIIITENMVIK